LFVVVVLYLFLSMVMSIAQDCNRAGLIIIILGYIFFMLSLS
jgi:hypothetical protein